MTGHRRASMARSGTTDPRVACMSARTEIQTCACMPNPEFPDRPAGTDLQRWHPYCRLLIQRLGPPREKGLWLSRSSLELLRAANNRAYFFEQQIAVAKSRSRTAKLRSELWTHQLIRQMNVTWQAAFLGLSMNPSGAVNEKGIFTPNFVIFRTNSPLTIRIRHEKSPVVSVRPLR